MRRPAWHKYLDLSGMEVEIFKGEMAGFWVIKGGNITYDFQSGWDSDAGRDEAIDIANEGCWLLAEMLGSDGEADRELKLDGAGVWRLLDEDKITEAIGEKESMWT